MLVQKATTKQLLEWIKMNEKYMRPAESNLH